MYQPLDLSKINFVSFPDSKYFRDEFDKKQIVLHHTVSGPGIRGDLNTWLANPHRVSTCIIIDRDGTPNQMFSSKYWAYHTGKGSRIDKHSIAIEFDNWGGLTKQGDDYYAVYGNKVNVPVTAYPGGWRGFDYYESYTEAQITTAMELCVFWNQRYGIPLTYHEDMWDISDRALSGEAGIWSHVSYRPASDKQDAHPQPELIEALKSLT